VTRRALGDGAAGDSALARVAGRPGFSFYRAAARDTLGIRGWPGGVAVGACADSATCAPLALARTLIALGAPEEASLVIARWSADDPRLPGGRAASPLSARLEAARLAFAAGRIGQGIGLADAASRAPEEDAARFGGEDAWAITPWIFPPAFESLMVAPSDTAAALEPALLWAVTTQESRFDPRARSRSDALGLLQLKLDAARDVARWRRDPPPSESTLTDPATSVTYGARYLKRLVGRFEGSLAVALVAYNTGGSTVPRWWRDLLGRGGEALVCELVPSGGEYAKRILGYRQAYRELRPTAAVP
jgi:soluble lytic murein transglycosylase